MRDFDLVSVDWDTVRLMQAGQFKQETYYHEELTRWILERGRYEGILHLADNGVSLPSPEGGQSFNVTVRGCLAVTPRGYIIDIADDRSTVLSGTIEARGATVPMYVGVAVTGRDKESNLQPSVDTGLLGCGGLRRNYKIASDDSDTTYDWLQIALFEKSTTGLRSSPTYVPECLFIGSHVGLMRFQSDIGEVAKQCLDMLTKEAGKSPIRFSVASSLCASLGPATRVVDPRLSPRAYIDRLAGILVSQHSQLLALPSPGQKAYQDAIDTIADFLAYLDGAESTIGQSLFLAQSCFERLLDLFSVLLKGIETAGPAPERVSFGQTTAVPANAPIPDPAPLRPGGFMRRK